MWTKIIHQAETLYHLEQLESTAATPTSLAMPYVLPFELGKLCQVVWRMSWAMASTALFGFVRAANGTSQEQLLCSSEDKNCSCTQFLVPSPFLSICAISRFKPCLHLAFVPNTAIWWSATRVAVPVQTPIIDRVKNSKLLQLTPFQAGVAPPLQITVLPVSKELQWCKYNVGCNWGNKDKPLNWYIMGQTFNWCNLT